VQKEGKEKSYAVYLWDIPPSLYKKPVLEIDKEDFKINPPFPEISKSSIYKIELPPRFVSSRTSPKRKTFMHPF